MPVPLYTRLTGQPQYCYIDAFFLLSRRAAALKSCNTQALRPLQAQLLDRLKQGGNRILVAKTGFGKTRVAEELIKALLGRKRRARVLFLTDKVMLAMQQAGKAACAQ